MRQTVGFTRATEWVRGGFATPHQLAANDMLSSRVDRSSKTYKPAELSGCIYRADGTKVPLSERPAGRGDLIIASNPDHVDPPADAAKRAPRRAAAPPHSIEVLMNRSTKMAPEALSTSYFTGSAFIGISMMTLKESGTLLPGVTLSRDMVVGLV